MPHKIDPLINLYLPRKSKDYFLRGFSVKTIVLVRVYNQQFQGTILLMAFDFQGLYNWISLGDLFTSNYNSSSKNILPGCQGHPHLVSSGASPCPKPIGVKPQSEKNKSSIPLHLKNQGPLSNRI